MTESREEIAKTIYQIWFQSKNSLITEECSNVAEYVLYKITAAEKKARVEVAKEILERFTNRSIEYYKNTTCEPPYSLKQLWVNGCNFCKKIIIANSEGGGGG